MIYTKIQWGIVFATLIVDIIWIKFSSISFYYNSKKLLVFSLLLIILYIPYVLYRKFRPDPKIMMALQATLIFLSYSTVIFVLSYLACTTNQPLVDSTLASMDRYLGFYSPSLIFWFRDHAIWNYIFGFIYDAYYFQMPFVLLYVSFFGETNYLQKYLMQYMIASLLTICIAGFFPAVGTYGWYPYPPEPSQLSELQRFYELRQNIVDLRASDGIITFPSFHTTMGILYICAFLHERKIIFIPILILNALMIFSCLSHGGHFLVDIWGGIVVFVIALGIERLIFWSVKKYGIIDS